MTNPKRTPDEVATRRIAQLEAELAPTLRDFRSASIAYAEREHTLLSQQAITTETGKLTDWKTGSWKPKAGRWQRWTITATAVCALLLFAVILKSFETKDPRIAPSSKSDGLTLTQTAPISDEALLETVASDLSTSVPTPLQSLAPQQSTSTTSTITQ